MKEIQIHLRDGCVRSFSADRVEVRKAQVILYVQDQIIEAFDRALVLMIDEVDGSEEGAKISGETEIQMSRELPNAEG